MKYLPFDARCVFIDGPVAVYVHEADEQAILDAYDNLRRVVEVAARQLHKPETPEPTGLDTCTDPDNCSRCKAPPMLRPGMHHAGIPLEKRYAYSPR